MKEESFIWPDFTPMKISPRIKFKPLSWIWWTWCNLLPSPPLPSSNTTYQRVTFFLISALLHLLCPLPWFVNSFCPNSIPAEPCYPCIDPFLLAQGILGCSNLHHAHLLCGWLTCKSSSLIRTVISLRAGVTTSHFLYPQCQPNA